MSTMNVFTILVGTAGVLAVISLIKPNWSLCPVAVLLIAVALFVK